MPTSRPHNAIRIGALVPLTRPGWVESGRHLLAGLELGVRDANSDGSSLTLDVRDTAGDPQRAVLAVDELAHSGVTALAGEFHSVVARAVATRAQELGLPFLCSSAVLDALTDSPAPLVARIAPAQSYGWRVYAEYLREAGHRRVALAMDASIYWSSGARILRSTFGSHDDLLELDVRAHGAARIGDALVAHCATAVLLLTGYPEPAISIAKAVRNDGRLPDILIGAPAGQPELASWMDALGSDGAGVPFLRYLPDRFGTLGRRVETQLRAHLSAEPTFVAFEGYDTALAVAEMLRTREPWSSVSVEGTRGTIQFSRVPGIPVAQWAWPPVQVVDRDPAEPRRFRVLRST